MSDGNPQIKEVFNFRNFHKMILKFQHNLREGSRFYWVNFYERDYDKHSKLASIKHPNIIYCSCKSYIIHLI